MMNEWVIGWGILVLLAGACGSEAALGAADAAVAHDGTAVGDEVTEAEADGVEEQGDAVEGPEDAVSVDLGELQVVADVSDVPTISDTPGTSSDEGPGYQYDVGEGGSCGHEAFCADGLFCKTKSGQCGGHGECEPPPTECTDGVVEPVCGCDGNPYESPCEALKNSTAVAADPWACREIPCSGLSDCDPSAFCDFFPTDLCGQFGEGICRARPTEECQGDYAACGCDGVTYPNACEAAKAGTTMAYDLECGNPLAPCFGIVGECDADEFCHFSEWDQGCITPGESFEVGGVCELRPTECAPDAPACGCDGKTYASVCEAAKMGTYATPGACPEP